MMYIDFNAGGKDYKLRLATRNIVALEKAIGCNPLSIFGNGEELPSITTMVMILWQSLQKFHHNIGLNEAYDIFDEYLEENTAMDFITVILAIYKVSRIIKNDNNKTEESGKN